MHFLNVKESEVWVAFMLMNGHGTIHDLNPTWWTGSTGIAVELQQQQKQQTMGCQFWSLPGLSNQRPSPTVTHGPGRFLLNSSSWARFGVNIVLNY